jgi:hypothetical protein
LQPRVAKSWQVRTRDESSYPFIGAQLASLSASGTDGVCLPSNFVASADLYPSHVTGKHEASEFDARVGRRSSL